MKLAVVAFPGSTGQDTLQALTALEGAEVTALDQDETNLEDYDAIILPSGSSYGDYLRPGAIAAKDPVMGAVAEFADGGGLVVGFGNGFQILTEAGLLPGALLQNEGAHFICATPTTIVTTPASPLTDAVEPGTRVKLPIAHGYGNYWCDTQTAAALEANDQIILQYETDVDGSTKNIAGICNAAGNVVGMMPLPERAMEQILGSADGLLFFQSLMISHSATTEPVEA